MNRRLEKLAAKTRNPDTAPEKEPTEQADGIEYVLNLKVFESVTDCDNLQRKITSQIGEAETVLELVRYALSNPDESYTPEQEKMAEKIIKSIAWEAVNDNSWYFTRVFIGEMFESPYVDFSAFFKEGQEEIKFSDDFPKPLFKGNLLDLFIDDVDKNGNRYKKLNVEFGYGWK